VGDVFDVLRASHYHLLTEPEWRLALSESFKLTLPMDVEWGYMDDGLLRRFWESSPRRKRLREHLPDEVRGAGGGGKGLAVRPAAASRVGGGMRAGPGGTVRRECL